MNNNIQEDYVSFEVSKLLKEKGFDVSYCKYWNLSYEDKNHKSLSLFKNEHINTVKAPTTALAIKWIRENFNYHITTEPIPYTSKNINFKWIFKIQHLIINSDNYSNESEVSELIVPKQYFNTEKEAIDAALLYTLKNLIE